MDALTVGQESLSTKLDSMASKDDRQTLKKDMIQETKVLVSEAVDPLKSDVCDVKKRLVKLETAPAPSSSTSSSSAIRPDVKMLLDSLDPAHKQITFHGFSVEMDQKARAQNMQKFLEGYPNIPVVRNFVAHLKGPRNSKQITKMSYAEFSSVDDAREALKVLKTASFQISTNKITIKGSLTKINSARNWAL